MKKLRKNIPSNNKWFKKKTKRIFYCVSEVSTAKYSSQNLKLIKTQKMLSWPILYNHYTLSQLFFYNLPLSELRKQTPRKKHGGPMMHSTNATHPQHQIESSARAKTPPSETLSTDHIVTGHLACAFLALFLSYFVLSSLFSFYSLNNHN